MRFPRAGRAILLPFIICLGMGVILIPFSISANAAVQDFQCYKLPYLADHEQFETSAIIAARKGEFATGVFQHTGGGPNGSHWNFSGMTEGIFCVAVVPIRGNDVKSITVQVGRKNIKIQARQEQVSEERLLLSFSLPFESIERAARKIKRADLPLLYSDRKEEIALYLKNGTWDGVAPPDLEELVEINLHIHTKAGRVYLFRRMIHAAYGE